MHFHLKTILQTSADFTIIIFDIPNRMSNTTDYHIHWDTFMVQLLRLRNFDIDWNNKKPKIRQWTHSRPVFFHWNINCHLFMRVQERIITPFMFSLSCFSSSSSFLGIIHRYWIAHHIRASHTHWAKVICWNPNEQKYKRFFLS